MAAPSDLEAEFATRWRQLGGPDLVPEYRFASGRKWRFDFAHPHTLVAVELEGGVHTNGRHVRAAGFVRDCEKYNAATADGWAVFRFTADMLRDDPSAHLEPVMQVIRYRDAIRCLGWRSVSVEGYASMGQAEWWEIMDGPQEATA